MFLTKTQDPDNTLRRALSDAEKLQFVSKSVFWIQGKDTMDSCFILNFGYEASLPWPQVRIRIGGKITLDKTLEADISINKTSYLLILVPDESSCSLLSKTVPGFEIRLKLKPSL